VTRASRWSSVALALFVAAGQQSIAEPEKYYPTAQTGGLALRATLVFDDPARSMAYVSFASGEMIRAHIGSSLPQLGVLTAIEAKRIVVRRGGALYSLSFYDSDGVATTTAAAPAVAGSAMAEIPAMPQPALESHDNGDVKWDDMSRRPKTPYEIIRDPITGKRIGIRPRQP
jgi:hypothetical protein